MQGSIKMADLLEDIVRSCVMRLPNDFIPQGAEIMLELGKSVVAYVKLRKHPQDVCIPRWVIGMKQVAGNVEQDDE
jgi:hypothetical protein